ncbi:MAG: hypothetical protein JWM10_51 [Myxococcaceae bacterium]|nr:hypothetical protein [Myxococcaceae bacterium]
MLLADTPLDPRALVSHIWQPSDLPDSRLFVRLQTSAALMFDRFDEPTATHSRAARRGFQRLCHNPRVDDERLARRARERTLQGLHGVEVLVLAYDTTEVDKVGPAEPDDAGPLRSNRSRGYLVHSCVAVDPAHHALLGVVDTHAWTRSWNLRGQNHKSRAPHQKESSKWRRGIRRVVLALQAAGVRATVIHALDREGDVYENFTFARRHGHRVVVRAAQDRRIAESEEHLWASLGGREAAHSFEHEVRTEVSAAALAAAKRQGARAVEALRARVAKLPARRTATVHLRFATVTLLPPERRKHRPKAVAVAAISVREDDAPAGVEPIDWVLLTTCAVGSVAEALAVMGFYEDRYLIEPVHRIWKSALRLEDEPIADVASFRRQLAIVMPLASHIAQWTYAARVTPQAPASAHVSAEVLAGLKEACRYHELPLPRRAWTIKDVVTKLAGLGGYEVRPDRKPGWIVLWRGWRKLRRFMDLFAYAQTRRKQAPQ